MSNLASKNIFGVGETVKKVAPANSMFSTVGNGVVQAANSVGNGVVQAANSVGDGVIKTVNSLGDGVVQAANTMGTNVVKAANTMGTNVVKAANNIALNSHNTFGTSLVNTAKNKNANSLFGPLENTSKNTSSTNTSSTNTSSTNTSSLLSSDWIMPFSIFVSMLIAFIVIFIYFASEIKAGYTNISNAIRSLINAPVSPPVPIIVTSPPPTTSAAPSNNTAQSQSILESVLPLHGPPEVFNVSKNEFSYYDAEPLCKALGAELATYEQVKDAYGKGADWCNYGWVKGQVAIYPTQKSTWDELQNGVEDERGACGKPGVNGGYFDNPEMKFGVNCYGPKPAQSAHDEAELMKQGRLPSTVASLKTEQKVKEFEAQADVLGVMPFNKNKWQST